MVRPVVERGPGLVEPKIDTSDGLHPDSTTASLCLGALPDRALHGFQGRNRELLALEGLLRREQWALVRGIGGSGKTALATELARRVVHTRRFKRAAFVKLERYRDVLAVVDTLGKQLLPHSNNYSVAEYKSLKEALQPIGQALRDNATVIVLDNCENVLPSIPEARADEKRSYDAFQAILDLCQSVLSASEATRIIFTSRERLIAPFDQAKQQLKIGALDRTDAIDLVSEVMKHNNWIPAKSDPGNDPQEIEDLVEAANCHARTLVLLAREVSQSGIVDATDNLRKLMAQLERRNPGDRENSLYASVELSLRRLSKETRERIEILGVAQGGVHLGVFGMLTGLKPDEVWSLSTELLRVSLAEDMGDGHLRLDPALGPYLLREVAEDKAEAYRTRFSEAMAALTKYLHQQLFKDGRLATRITLFELSNLVAMLRYLQQTWPPERVVDLADNVKSLISNLGQPRVLAFTVAIHEQAAKKLGDWRHTRFTSESASINRLLEVGNIQAAHRAAESVLKSALVAGESAYPQAGHDIAVAHFRLARVLQMGGAAEAALKPLSEAKRRLQQLADSGNESAERMALVAIVEAADCLCDLGRLDEAASAYEESIIRAVGINESRQVAFAKLRLGTVRLLQKRYDDALLAYEESRNTLEELGETLTLAGTWHKIAQVHEKVGRFDSAEKAYRQSLAIRVRENDLAGQADSLNQLGNLSGAQNRFEGAAKLYRQCVELYAELGDSAKEGFVRSYLADTLIKLQRYDEARHEIERAMECGNPYGYASQPWRSWSILEDLENATGNQQAAATARQHAIGSYLAYRRAGGASETQTTKLMSLVAQSIQQNQIEQVETLLTQIDSEQDTPPFVVALFAKLKAVLAGARGVTLAADPDLQYRDAAELILLLELLSKSQR